MRTMMMALLVTCACGTEVKTSTSDQDSTLGCHDGLGPIRCYPNDPFTSSAFCASECMEFQGVTGYCPDYTTTEIRHCQQDCATHPGGVGVDDTHCNIFTCYPLSAHFCLSGEQP